MPAPVHVEPMAMGFFVGSLVGLLLVVLELNELLDGRRMSSPGGREEKRKENEDNNSQKLSYNSCSMSQKRLEIENSSRVSFSLQKFIFFPFIQCDSVRISFQNFDEHSNQLLGEFATFFIALVAHDAAVGYQAQMVDEFFDFSVEFTQ